ncbi:glycoside hydrolase family 127 protein, partial [Verrucomicrobiaceae bacterium E54]|nr:glycoside hydrolase family 127 protein [Verrucomicrobiaceae bacterium E54]
MLACTSCKATAQTSPLAPQKGLREVDGRNVTLTGGFWGTRVDRHHRITIPHVLDKLEERHHFSNFDLAAKVVGGDLGMLDGGNADEAHNPLEGDPGATEHSDNRKKGNAIVGNHAYDSDAYKGLEGACHSLCNHEDPALLERVDAIIDRIIAAQQEDGYLNSYYTAKEPENKWSNLRLNHEMYNAGHFMELAVAHHQLTGSTKALDAARRLADHIDANFGPGKRYDVGGHQEIELALIKLYRVTGEERYLKLSRFFLEERGHAHGSERRAFTDVPPRTVPEKRPDETMRKFRLRKWSTRNGRMQDHKPLLEQKEAVGHAVRAGYTYSAMADLARFNEAPDYADAVRILWEDVVFRKMYLTGGLGTAQYGDEGFGDPYLLPNDTYCESCANIAHVFWQHRMNLMDAEAKYADILELTLYNGALSGVALSGDAFFYRNPLESAEGEERVPWIGLACCPTNLARFIPQVGGYLYATKDNALYVNLYAAGQASVDLGDSGSIKLEQETDFPWDGGIQIKVTPGKASVFDLKLRIPGWAVGRTVPGTLYRDELNQPAAVGLRLNGKPVDTTPGPDGYLSLKRKWQPGDRIELDLPMPVRRIHAHPKLEENRGRVALMRGPVVYAFE